MAGTGVSDIPAEMRLGALSEITQETEGESLTRDELFLGAPMRVLGQYLERTGQPALPPEWSFGIWISGNGWNTDEEVV